MRLGDEMTRWRVVPERLSHWAATRPHSRFLNCGSGWMSFAEVEQRADALAGALAARGVAKGDRVGVILPNCAEFAVSIFACAKLGAIQVPLNVYLKGEFLGHQLRDSGALAVIADEVGLAETERLEVPDLRLRIGVRAGPRPPRGVEDFAALERAGERAPSVAISPDDVMSIMYTSGTTGAPKGCMLSHAYYLYLPWGWYENDWYRTDDVLISPLPMFHVAGQGITLMGALLGGLPLTLLPGFSASSFIGQAGAAGATMANGVGPMGTAILATAPGPSDRAHQLRACVWPPMPPQARERFAERFGIPAIAEGYGQTECNPIAQSPLDRQGMTPGCLGLPSPHLDVEIHDGGGRRVAAGEVGEIVIRPREPGVMFSGYWRRPEATVEVSRNLWHHTGDSGRQDERGYFVFVDRTKDAMRRRGENVSSIELERAIGHHPRVAAVATHAVPSPLGEDDIKAWLVLTPGPAIDPGELHGYLAENLPYFAVPRYVEITGELPVNALGRVQKFVLRDRPNDQAWDFEALGLGIDRSRRRCRP
jgi:crotonobetaine/carnitine-CoA ligase